MQYQTVSALLTATAEVAAITRVTPSQRPTQKPSLPAQGTDTPFVETTEESALVVVETLPAVEEPEKAINGEALPAVECDLAQPGRPMDITIPDETRIHPGEYFSKTWRLVNGGSCVWNQEYSVVWFSGEDLGINHALRFNSEIAPGAPVDVTVDMVAPETPGTYQSNWKVRNGHGELFGIGPNGDAPFWVRIIVVPLETATATATFAPPTVTATPAPISAGAPVVKLADGIDLDTGLLNQPEEDDLRFELGEEEGPVLAPVGNALVAPFGAGQPDFNSCLLAPLSAEVVRLDLYQPGMYFCYRTSLGLPGWFLLSSLNLDTGEAGLEFTTWAMP